MSLSTINIANMAKVADTLVLQPVLACFVLHNVLCGKCHQHIKGVVHEQITAHILESGYSTVTCRRSPYQTQQQEKRACFRSYFKSTLLRGINSKQSRIFLYLPKMLTIVYTVQIGTHYIHTYMMLYMIIYDEMMDNIYLII